VARSKKYLFLPRHFLEYRGILGDNTQRESCGPISNRANTGLRERTAKELRIASDSVNWRLCICLPISGQSPPKMAMIIAAVIGRQNTGRFCRPALKRKRLRWFFETPRFALKHLLYGTKHGGISDSQNMTQGCLLLAGRPSTPTFMIRFEVRGRSSTWPLKFMYRLL